MFGAHTSRMTFQSVTFFLAFHGGNCFQPTRLMSSDEFAKSQDTVGRVQAYLDELSLKENVQNMHKKQAKDYRWKVDKIESEEEDSDEECGTSDEVLDLEKVMEEDSTSKQANDNVVPPGLDLTTQPKGKNSPVTCENVKLSKDVKYVPHCHVPCHPCLPSRSMHYYAQFQKDPFRTRMHPCTHLHLLGISQNLFATARFMVSSNAMKKIQIAWTLGAANPMKQPTPWRRVFRI